MLCRNPIETDQRHPTGRSKSVRLWQELETLDVDLLRDPDRIVALDTGAQCFQSSNVRTETVRSAPPWTNGRCASLVLRRRSQRSIKSGSRKCMDALHALAVFYSSLENVRKPRDLGV